MSEFEHIDQDHSEPSGMSFDFRGYLFKVLNLWKFVLVCIGVALIIAYLINVRKQSIYKLSSLINVESDQNPFFTANTSISFNWGGVSGKVGKVMTTVKTRTHNELVMDSLKYYMEYLKEGKYRLEDIYKNAPFEIRLDNTKGQMLSKPIGIRFIGDNKFEIFLEFESEGIQTQRYGDKLKASATVPIGNFNKIFSFGETINLPFFNGIVNRRFDKTPSKGTTFYFKFLNFDSIVNSYKNGIFINTYSGNASSVLELSLAGNNKAKIVDYLNTTTAILSETELERKNLYATNTIKFIDSSLGAVNTELKDVTNEMNKFRKDNQMFDVTAEMTLITEKLRGFDLRKEEEQTKLNYLDFLENYLRTKTDFTKIAAPTSVGITEGNILSSVAKIQALASERQSKEYTVQEGNLIFKDIDRQINAEKNVLLETLAATKQTIGLNLNSLNNSIARLERDLADLPEDQQQYLKIQRKLNMSQEAYNIYLTKRGEAAIVKAANVSDIASIDEAKDIGGGRIGPNHSLNYMMALMVGFFSPMFLIFVVFLLDNTIHGSDEVERLSNIPILGLDW